MTVCNRVLHCAFAQSQLCQKQVDYYISEIQDYCESIKIQKSNIAGYMSQVSLFPNLIHAASPRDSCRRSAHKLSPLDTVPLLDLKTPCSFLIQFNRFS